MSPALDLVGPILSSALVCARDGLSAPPARGFIATGQIAWDDCCAGQVWARLIDMTPLEGATGGLTGRVTAGGQPCGPLMWRATIGVGVLRCAAVVNESGDAPAAAVLSTEALRTLMDMAELSEALQCCFAPQVDRLAMQRWDPLGPDGGCVGGEWTFTVLVDACRCSS